MGVALALWMAGGCSKKPADNFGNQDICGKHMLSIEKAIEYYCGEHNMHYPPDLAALVRFSRISPRAFICPSSGTQLPANIGSMTVDQIADWVGQHSDYVYAGSGLSSPTSEAYVVLYEHEANHDGAGMNVLFSNGRVEFLSLRDAKTVIDRSNADRGIITVKAP